MSFLFNCRLGTLILCLMKVSQVDIGLFCSWSQRKNACLPLSMMLAVGLLVHMTFLILRNILSVPSLLTVFYYEWIWILFTFHGLVEMIIQFLTFILCGIIFISFDCCWSSVLLATSCLFYISIYNFRYLNETFHIYGCQVHIIIIILGKVVQAAREGLIPESWELLGRLQFFRSKNRWITTKEFTQYVSLNKFTLGGWE